MSDDIMKMCADVDVMERKGRAGSARLFLIHLGRVGYLITTRFPKALFLKQLCRM